MNHIACCVKSKLSYNRITSQFNRSDFDWEEYIQDIEEIQEKMMFNTYDLAIIDEKIWWKDEAIELFNKKNVQVIIFQGDFEEVEKFINEIFPIVEEESENEVSNSEVLNSSTSESKEDNREIRYIETERIIEKEVKVKVEVYKEVYADIPKKTVMIANLSERAGSTFITLNLAKALSELKILPCVIEPPIKKPYIFDAIGLEQRLNKTEMMESLNFYSYLHEIYDGKKVERNKETIEDDIVWVVADSRKQLLNLDKSKWGYIEMMKLIHASKKGNITLLDVGSGLNKDYIQEVLGEMDLIIIAVDPMPVEIMQNMELLERLNELKKNGYNIEFVFNKWTNGVNKKELLKSIDIQPLTYIENIDLKHIHKSIYNCKIPYEYTEVKEGMEYSIDKIITEIVPKKFIDETKGSEKKHNIFGKITSLLRKDESE